MKTNMRHFIFVTYFLFILSSCSDNNIYFDINSQSVKSCNKKVIKKLYVTSENGQDFYYFLKLPKTEGTNSFSLIKKNHNYLLKDMYGEINIDSFRLKSETTYKIENSTFGDAASSEVLVRTDKKGKIIYSNIVSCK